MRRRILLLLIILVALLPLIGLTQAFTPQTLPQLAASAPSVFSYEGIAHGRTIAIAAPIRLPQTQAMPVDKVRFIHVEANNGLADIQTALRASQDFRRMDVRTDVLGGSRFSASTPEIEKRTSYTKGGYKSLFFPTSLERQPSANPTPPEQPFKTASGLLRLLCPEATFYLNGQYATGGGYETKMDGQYNPSDEEMLKLKPLAGYEQGYYSALLSQRMHSIPIFPAGYFVLGGETEPLDPVAFVHISPYFDKDNFHMEGQAVRSISTLVPDAILAPFERIEQVIMANINNGRIRAVDSITLGYMIYYAQPTTSQQAHRGADMVLIPTWEVLGNIAYDEQMETHPTSLRDQLMRDTATSRGITAFRIDALTGLPLDQYASPAPRSYPLESLVP